MSTIYFNIVPNLNGGGPSVWTYRMAQSLKKLGHTVIFDNPQLSDVAICVINVGKTIKSINRDKTRIILRIDGIYNAEYNKLFNRAIRPDMIALHDDLKQNIPIVDHVVYQSQWSKDRIDDEIVKRDTNYSIIHNGVDTSLFKPDNSKHSVIKLFHIGKIRDGYIMECILGVFNELRRRKYNVGLVIVGSMDAECSKIYSANSSQNIEYLGSCSNTAAANVFSFGDICLGPRMGSSNDNAIIEALSCGLPVVVSAWGGNAELISDGKQGIIVDSGGHWNYGKEYIKKMADGVEKIILNLDEYKRSARQLAEKELTLDKMIESYLKAMNI